MSQEIPTDPQAFFSEFFPAQYAANPQLYPRKTVPGASSITVFGVGTWSFRVRDGKLEVTQGLAEDTYLQLGLTPDDFQAIYVARSQREINATGDLSADSKNVFRPMFPTEERWEIVRTNRGSVTLVLNENGAEHKLVITPGAAEPGESKAVVRVTLEDFLGLVAGRLKATSLLVDGRLKIKGDLAHALKLNSLLL